MQIILSETLKKTYQEAAKHLKGSARRKFMAGIVADMVRGGLSYCARELGWDFKTMQKGSQELESGLDFRDVRENQGRKRVEETLPNLLADMKSQTDATFQSQRLYTRLSVREMREQLIVQRGYTNEELPSLERLDGLEKWFVTISPTAP